MGWFGDDPTSGSVMALQGRPIAYKLADAAEAVGVDVSTLRRAIHTTDPRSYPPPLRAKLAGRKYLILTKDLERWAESLPDG